LNITGEVRSPPGETELLLFRITQEALRNVLRHAVVTCAEIAVQFDEAKTKVTVSDNGKGFTTPDTASDLVLSGKSGIIGIRERTRLIGGTLLVQSEIGIGTHVTLWMLS
jgi:signal transduction histidine kinase